jgi:predicted RNA-binding Zn-ribbon protein involved in translation (DUF1610 family)
MEPWKVILCSSEKCMAGALDEKGKVKEDYLIRPDIDNRTVTHFTCPRCGKVEAWGATRREVARILYERFKK